MPGSTVHLTHAPTYSRGIRLIFGGTSCASLTFPILCAPVPSASAVQKYRPERSGRIRTISPVVQNSITWYQVLTQIPYPAVRIVLLSTLNFQHVPRASNFQPRSWFPAFLGSLLVWRIEQNRTIPEICDTGPLRQRHLRQRLYKSFDFPPFCVLAVQRAPPEDPNETERFTQGSSASTTLTMDHENPTTNNQIL